MSDQGTSAFVEQFLVDGRRIDCYGSAYPETPLGAFDHYDLFEDGFCLNEGDPLYERPTLADAITAAGRGRSI
jgi:hypothetical protein